MLGRVGQRDRGAGLGQRLARRAPSRAASLPRAAWRLMRHSASFGAGHLLDAGHRRGGVRGGAPGRAATCARSTRIVERNQRSPISRATRSASSSAASAAAGSPASSSAWASNTAIQIEAWCSPSSLRPSRERASCARAALEVAGHGVEHRGEAAHAELGEATPGDLAQRARRTPRARRRTGTRLTTSAQAMKLTPRIELDGAAGAAREAQGLRARAGRAPTRPAASELAHQVARPRDADVVAERLERHGGGLGDGERRGRVHRLGVPVGAHALRARPRRAGARDRAGGRRLVRHPLRALQAADLEQGGPHGRQQLGAGAVAGRQEGQRALEEAISDSRSPRRCTSCAASASRAPRRARAPRAAPPARAARSRRGGALELRADARARLGHRGAQVREPCRPAARARRRARPAASPRRRRRGRARGRSERRADRR